MISKLLQWARPSGPNHTETCRCEPGTGTSGIYIQGCARSGNTLMRNLCVAAFAKAELAKLHDDAAEISFGRFVQFLGHGKVWVASRNQRSSLEMTAQELHSYPNVKVLWMLRDPRDVLTSVHRMDASKFWVSPERWIKSIELYHQLKNDGWSKLRTKCNMNYPRFSAFNPPASFPKRTIISQHSRRTSGRCIRSVKWIQEVFKNGVPTRIWQPTSPS
jgi:hypothetical protein